MTGIAPSPVPQANRGSEKTKKTVIRFESDFLAWLERPFDPPIEMNFNLNRKVMDEAVGLLTKLNKHRLPDGTRASAVIKVDGFEPWWFRQYELFWDFIVPFARYEKVISMLLEEPSIELATVPPPLRRLIALLEPHLSAPVALIEAQSAKPKESDQPGTGRTVLQKLLLAGFSIGSLFAFAMSRRKVLLYTVDKVSPGSRHDFRLDSIYQELQARQLKFAEYIHIGDSSIVATNLMKRRRPAVCFEVLAGPLLKLSAFRRLVSKGNRPDSQQLEPNPSTDSLLLRAGNRHAIELALDAKVRYRAIKLMLNLQRPLIALVLDDERHTNELVAACRQCGIFTLEYQHGLGLSPYSVGLACYGFDDTARRHTADKYGLWSQYFVDRILGFTNLYRKEDLFVCGSLRPPAYSFQEKAVAKPDVINVLLVSEPVLRDSEVESFLRPLLDDRRFSVKIKLRPGEEPPALVGKIWHDDPKKHVLKTGTVYEAFEQTDVVLGNYSSVLYEAVLAMKPVVVFGTSSPFQTELAEQGLADFASTPQEIKKTIDRSLEVSPEELVRKCNHLWGDFRSSGRGAALLFESIPNHLFNFNAG